MSIGTRGKWLGRWVCGGPSSWYTCRGFRTLRIILGLHLRLEVASQELIVAETDVLCCFWPEQWFLNSNKQILDLCSVVQYHKKLDLVKQSLHSCITMGWSWATVISSLLHHTASLVLSVAIHNQDWWILFNSREIFLCIQFLPKTRNILGNSRFFLYLVCFTYLHHPSGLSLKWEM